MIIPAKEQTSAAVAQHYDDLDPFYRELWGDHVHHGLWTTGLENPAQAVENLIACVARRLELDPGQHVCDVGCGYGATAQWLAEHHGVHVTGLTISAVQAQRASERSTGSSPLPAVNITAYKKADGTWGGSSSSEPHDAIVRTKSVYGNARQRYGVNRPRRTRRTSSKNQIISMY